MAKTEETVKLEKEIFKATNKQGTFGCFEVTIGWFGKERVDYMTVDTKGVWRCYEIKVSVSDFRSKSAKTFCGNLNYFVMTNELYEKVKDEIPDGIGVYIGGWCKKRAKKRELGEDEETLKMSMIRSLAREAGKYHLMQDQDEVKRLRDRTKRLEKESNLNHRRYVKLSNYCYEKLGRGFLENID